MTYTRAHPRQTNQFKKPLITPPSTVDPEPNAQEWPRWRFLPFLEARAEARVLIKSAYMQSGEQWAEWCRQENKRPRDIPPNPNVFYKGKGWASWRDWIGYEQGDPRELMAIEPTGVTPLMEAARRGDVAQVKSLAMADAGLEAESTSQWTAAHYAALNGHQFVLGALHDAGANLMAQTNDGSTPAMLAAANGHLEAFDALLELELDMGKVVDGNGDTAIAIYRQRIDAEMRWAFSQDPSVNNEDTNATDYTPTVQI
eukprot:CAMPEP_0198204090 /NCGR_PEP_ID=MMETSP1445-20131203/7462_1 /TAXON_ID=36898 /ORGANISM="Pyramimonas sp., Strain CCMP2087" /LENGTH=256 /DNA_ID=CAMNT_0043875791 /DNA_START=335 /DNA_END=1105 /DNA_ORIENTATION=+